MSKWDNRFLGLAKHVADWSKDPSTQVGAVLVRDRFVVSMGFNGFPAGVADTAERMNNRDLKLKFTLHAEENAILTAHADLRGCTCYTWPIQPCARCAAKLAQAGIARVVAPEPSAAHALRWSTDFQVAETIFDECGIVLDLFDREL